MDQESLSMDIDFNKQLDIEKAITRLSPKEQLVVRCFVMGNETLDTLAHFSHYERLNLWRTWGEAKKKLQGYLTEYEPNKLGKTPLHALQEAVKSSMESDS
jgi:hypothetical protein